MERETRFRVGGEGKGKIEDKVPLFKPAFVRRAGVFLGLMAVFGAVSIGMRRSEPVEAYIVIALMVMIGAAYVNEIRGKGKLKMTEEEYEAEWAARQRRQEEMLAEAGERYAKGPVGGWQVYYVLQHEMGGSAVKARRVIEFQGEGKGRYRGFDVGGLAMMVEAEFEFMSVEPSRMKVKLAKPALAGWYEVKYGFDILVEDEVPKLMLWMESENPLPGELGELWPFRGEFLREEG